MMILWKLPFGILRVAFQYTYISFVQCDYRHRECYSTLFHRKHIHEINGNGLATLGLSLMLKGEHNLSRTP